MAESKKKKGVSLGDILAGMPDVSKSDTEGREQIEYIDIGRIHPDPKNFYSLDGLEDLAANIELVGLQQPLRLRPDPEADGEYIISSGHRRHGALTILVTSGKGAFALVPCIVEREAIKESAAMAELKLIYANSSTREMTSADKALQAERVTELLYRLKEEGVEFPGRMRDHVAEACQISASKLARLKVIQDKLAVPKFVEMWKAGKLKEDPAYALAQMPALMQEAIAKYKGELPSAEVLRKIQERGMKHYLSTPATCKGGEGCTNGGNFLHHDLKACYWDVGHCKCCVDCVNVKYCKYACPVGKEEAKKLEEKAAKEQEKRKKESDDWKARQKRRDEYVGSVVFPMAKRIAGLVGDQETLKAVVAACSDTVAQRDWYEGKCLQEVCFRADDDDPDPDEIDLYVSSLVAICRQLGVSADYLLGLADVPLTQAAQAGEDVAAPVATDGGRPQWRPGDEPPKTDCLCLCKFVGLRKNVYTIEAEWNRASGKWIIRPFGDKCGDECLGWYPIPNDEEEATE